MTTWKRYLSDHRVRFIEELLDFLRIPSISSLSDHTADVQHAARWVAGRLTAAGMEAVAVMPTAGHPVVCGHWLHAPGKPTVMIYGHFDTQPVDPLDLWSHDPFDPKVAGDRVYARGASDDKGNMLAPILAVEALMKTGGRLPVNVKCFFEGQEEIGSPDLPDFIDTYRDRLACDMVLSADGGQWAEDQPAIFVSLRGICALQIDVTGADRDVHSGTYGGTFMNPIHALAAIIASLRSTDGRIRVKGFYDTVRPLTDDDRARIAAIPYDESVFAGKLGVTALHGEPGFSTYERSWARPTLEVNGIWGGFQDEGIKTVIPAAAHAKITCRLVADQAPDDIVRQVTEHIYRHAPAGVRVDVRPLSGSAVPHTVPADHPGHLAAAQVLTKLYGKKPLVARMGGTIPVSGLFFRTLDAHMINFAFGLKDENIHAPDEFFRLSSFDRAQRAWAMLLEALADPASR